MSWLPPETTPFNPQIDDSVSREHGLYPKDLQQKPQGFPASPVNMPEVLREHGWWQCPTQNDRGKGPCGYWLSPQAKQAIESHDGYFTCPKCNHSYPLMDELPPEVSGGDEYFGSFRSGGGTRAGIPLADQGQIGENIIAHMGELPGYGPITWWHPGGALANSALDGTVRDWGIEVKTLNKEARHWRFNPDDGTGSHDVFDRKNEAAREMGLKGVLGVLVMLDYRRDVADIYVKEMPLSGWKSQTRTYSGISRFRTGSATRLVQEVPFDNPLKNPHDPSPTAYHDFETYESPQSMMPAHLPEPEPEAAPF